MKNWERVKIESKFSHEDLEDWAQSAKQETHQQTGPTIPDHRANILSNYIGLSIDERFIWKKSLDKCNLDH